MSKWESFEISTGGHHGEPIEVPTMRAHRGCPALVFDKPNRWGFSLKTVIRQVAKSLTEYRLKVHNQFLPIVVDTEDGAIKVDTLGAWIFGVKGYKGHFVFDGGVSDKIVIYYPPGTPPEALSLISKTVDKL